MAKNRNNKRDPRSRKRGRRPQKRRTGGLGRGLAFLLPILFILVIAGIVVQHRYMPTKEQADLDAYFSQVTSGDASQTSAQAAASSSGTEEATASGNASIFSDDNMAVVVDQYRLGAGAFTSGGQVYVALPLVQEFLNGRFYWDSSSQILIYTTPTDEIKVNIGEQQYYVSNTQNQVDYTILKSVSGTAYVSLDFVKNYTDLDYKTYDNPSRVVISSDFSEHTYAKVKKAAAVRIAGGVKSPVLTKVKKGTVLTVLGTEGKWTKVLADGGFTGYIKSSALRASYTETPQRDFQEPEYTSIHKDFDINLAWHQVTTQDANANIDSVLSEASGVNVISPTWFSASDNNGNISSLASSDYVTAAHEKGVEVWALAGNVDSSGVDMTQVFTNTSSREQLESQLISAAIEYKLDGINLDFENLSPQVGDAYIEFIRELSILCRKNNVVLSVDVAPQLASTSFYNRKEMGVVADYVILMAYDEHYAGSEAGSVSSLPWVKESVQNMLSIVPAEKLVLGIPLYTRLWQIASDGTVSSSAYGMQDIQDILNERGVTATWDDTTGQNFAQYEEDGNTYQVWIEDADSIGKKLEVMRDNGLAGCASWKVGFETSDIWGVISSYVN